MQVSAPPTSPRDGPAQRPAAAVAAPRIGILVVAYNAMATIESVLERIPGDVWDEVSEVAVFDDASHDATRDLALAHRDSRRLEKLTVVRNPTNLGYGGNQKAGYAYFEQRGIDVVVLLHGDGQYAPEVMRRLYEPIVAGEADAVFGTRMTPEYGGPLKGGMPLYKYAGNRILTGLENVALGMELTEFHSGYRAYGLAALREIALEGMTDDFHFDTEIIIKLRHHGLRIRETPIPTYYGDEICNVDGLRYARDVVRSLLRYRRTAAGGAVAPEFAELAPRYPVKPSPRSSHAVARRWAGQSRRILDIGCADGLLARALADAGNEVVGVDRLERPAAADALSAYIRADLDGDLAALEDALEPRSFDVVLLMDVLEHLREPERLLALCRRLMRPGGAVLVSVPNVANLTVRLSLLAGRWTYTEHGILDRTHLRHFTRRTARELLLRQGFAVVRETATPVPFEVPLGLDTDRLVVRAGIGLLHRLTRLWRGGLGYQLVFELRAAAV